MALIKPVVNEVECHPYLNQSKLQTVCEANAIKLIAYSPLGGSPQDAARSNVFDLKVRQSLRENPLVVKLGKKYGKSPEQVLLKFHTSSGRIVIPKSTTPSRIESNAAIFDFELTNDELEQLNALNNGQRYVDFNGSKLLNHKNFPFNDEF